MTDYYDILGIDQEADSQVVKRAYFQLVRKYSPERQPEEFQKIRNAYEVLSDPQARAQYDRVCQFPPDAALLYRNAEQALEMKDFDQAVVIYEKILKSYPDLAVIKAALAKAYEGAGKTGKAAAAWENLCKMEPGNPSYAAALANSYALRGWRKKAIAQYERAIALDGDDADLWLTFIGCYMKGRERREAWANAQKAVARSKERGFECLRLTMIALFMSLGAGSQYTEQYLQDILRMMKQGAEDEEKQELEAILKLLINTLEDDVLERMLPLLKEIASLLEDDSEFLESIAKVKLQNKVNQLDEEGFSPVIADLLDNLMDDCDCESCRSELMSMESEILINWQSYKQEIRRLRAEFPELYALHSSFFNEALRSKDLDKMIYKRVKELRKYHKKHPELFEDDDDDDDDEDDELELQPIRNKEPKIGRNDLCPCGSGKKFKKCCGT